jgi:hypothetical protein
MTDDAASEGRCNGAGLGREVRRSEVPVAYKIEIKIPILPQMNGNIPDMLSQPFRAA